MDIATKKPNDGRNSTQRPQSGTAGVAADKSVDRSNSTRCSHSSDTPEVAAEKSNSRGNSVQFPQIDTTVAEARKQADGNNSAQRSKRNSKLASILRSKVTRKLATVLSIRDKRHTPARSVNFLDLPVEIQLMIIRFALPPCYEATHEDYDRWFRATISIMRVNYMFRYEALNLANFPLHHTGVTIQGGSDPWNQFVPYPTPDVPESQIFEAMIPQWVLEVSDWNIPAMVPAKTKLFVPYMFPTFNPKAVSRLAEFCLRGVKIGLANYAILSRNNKARTMYVAKEGPFFNGEEMVVETLRDELGKLESLRGSPLLDNISARRITRYAYNDDETQVVHAIRYCHDFYYRHVKGPRT